MKGQVFGVDSLLEDGGSRGVRTPMGCGSVLKMTVESVLGRLQYPFPFFNCINFALVEMDQFFRQSNIIRIYGEETKLVRVRPNIETHIDHRIRSTS